MTITIPEFQKDITLGQYQEFEIVKARKDLTAFDVKKRKIKIFTKAKFVDIEGMSSADFELIARAIDKALKQEGVFQDKFYIGDVQLGFIPNFDDLQAKEWFDLSNYDTKVETLHNLMAILFRPINPEKTNNGYTITNYKGTKELAEAMKLTPLHIVQGALVFFWNLSNELREHTLRYTEQERLLKQKTTKSTMRNGGGIQRFTRWLKGNLGDLHTSKI